MFRLQRLEITGFKSFADYTEVIFTGDGITAVVGPNGCGKSNVSESISWVLGEQRAKALRGAEMQDVIFQGTSKRKPGGMAEVVLHLVRDEEAFFGDEENELGDIDEAISELDEHTVDFDEIEARATAEEKPSENGFHPETNGDAPSQELSPESAPDLDPQLAAVEAVAGTPVETLQAKPRPKRHWRPRRMALDFAPGESIAVTRRLYRSGESEYLLNGKICRLRDIQDLFSGTGLSGSHYAIIEQGRIGQILSSKPADRRALIEEAAGISKFRTRQRAAEARLESAKTNLRRISDIVEEVDKQVNVLRRQASKTKRYKVLKEEFRLTLRQLFAAEGRYLSALVEELEAKLLEALAHEQDLTAGVTAKEEDLRTATQTAREAEEILSGIRARHAENALQRDRAERDLRYKQEQVTGLSGRVEVLRNEIESTGQRLKAIKAESERLEIDEQRESGEAEKHSEALREAEAKYQSKITELRQIESDLEKTRNEVFQHTSAVDRLAEIKRQHENNIERLTERVEGLGREGQRAEESYTGFRDEHQSIQTQLAAARENHRTHIDERQNLQQSVSGARQVVKDAEGSLAKVRENLSRSRHRLETLRELEERRAIYAPAVQKLFAEQSRIGVKFTGTLADKLNVAADAEKAVENLFGTYLQSVLVETEEEARKVVDYLGKNNLGRIPVLVYSGGDGASTSNETGKNSKILGFLGAPKAFADVLSSIFAREVSADLVSDFETIKMGSAGIFVNFAGDLMIDGRLFIGGKASAGEKSSSLLAFKREMRELESAIEKFSGEAADAEKEVETHRAALIEREEGLTALQVQIINAEREVLSYEHQAKTLAQETERAERHKKVVGEEIKQIEAELAGVKIKVTETEDGSLKAMAAKQAASANFEALGKRLADARARVEDENAELTEKRTVAGVAAERRRSVSAALRRVEVESSELESRLFRQNREINESDANFRELSDAIEQLGNQVGTAKEEIEKEAAEITSASASLKTARDRADLTSSELADFNKRAADARNARAELEVSQAEAVTRLKNVNEICAHELNQTLVEVVETVEIAEDFELEAARQQTEDLRNRIEGFGAVNMLALEELSETEERFLFLTSQRQDIIDGISAAEEALREIKQRSREKFHQAFEAINEYFREFFLELFGGGKGEMTLIEAEDILESGIEIVAQPPGKRLQNILLLSGGEKAMTAIALVMAIFKYRPSPFCLLDEVDAPLDEANVGRFVNKIAEMSERTQFIVITHNKRTMEAAKALYGVTMEEAGVSKVVSVRFE